MSLDHIGDYQIVKELGAGSAGTIYQAKHPTTGEIVAIKLLSAEMSREETMQRRFLREMMVMSKLAHKNIVRYVEGGLHVDRFYYVMELVDCSTLKQVLSTRGALTWEEAAECAGQICEALQCAHDSGVIHRDLKPANLFLSSDGLIKLGDFGLARDLGEDRLTAEGITVGTCRYMSPEQIAGEDELTATADLYALGCLMFEMVTGKVPFDGATVFEILDQHYRADPPDAKVLAPRCPTELARLIERLMAKKSADRPQSAREVKADIDALLTAHQHPDESAATADANQEPKNLTQRLTTGPTAASHEVSWKALLLIGGGVVVAIVIASMLQRS